MNCKFSLNSDGSLVNVLFYGIGRNEEGFANKGSLIEDDTFTGIRNGQEFIVSLNNPGSSSVGGWVPNTKFNAIANVPEPTSMTLFLIGLGAIAVGRRLGKWAKPND